MNRFLSFLLIAIFGLSILSGCSDVPAVKIDLTDPHYSVREDSTEPVPSSITLSAEERETFDGYLDALTKAIEQVPAQIYVINFSGVSTGGEEKVRGYLLPLLRASFGEGQILERSQIDMLGVWAVPEGTTYLTDIQELWFSSYENTDHQLEYVLDFSRNGQPLRTVRFVKTQNGALTLKENTLFPNYDGKVPAYNVSASVEAVSLSKPAYYKGQINKTGIFEQPVLDGIEFTLKLEGTPVGGSVPGGFAGAFEGTVTIDGQSFPLTLDGSNLDIPTGLIPTPSDYYIAFSEVGIANAQDSTIYRNVYFIKTDLSRVVGLYAYHKGATISDWFETACVTKETFDHTVQTNNLRLTTMYSDIILQTYGNRKEYNSTLAVLYNMFIGVEQHYLKANLKKAIAPISKDIRDYEEALKDSSLARLGKNGYYFFPNGRSMVVRLLAYQKTTAIAAIDFSSKLDDGYGGLYRAEYSDGHWSLTALQQTRIK